MANTDMPVWLSQAERLENRYEELSVQISQPDVIADMPLWRKLMREHSELEEVHARTGEYKRPQIYCRSAWACRRRQHPRLTIRAEV